MKIENLQSLGQVELRKQVTSEETTPTNYEYIGESYKGLTVMRYESYLKGIQIGADDGGRRFNNHGASWKAEFSIVEKKR